MMPVLATLLSFHAFSSRKPQEYPHEFYSLNEKSADSYFCC